MRHAHIFLINNVGVATEEGSDTAWRLLHIKMHLMFRSSVSVESVEECHICVVIKSIHLNIFLFNTVDH